MKKIYILVFSVFFSCSTQNNESTKVTEKSTSEISEIPSSIYELKMKDINGDMFDFSSLKGRKLLLVNTASKCGLTPQYRELQELYDLYKSTGFTVIGFPANDFKNQESGNDAEIKKFCEVNYGVSFPMMSKISVIGEGQHPLYTYLTKKQFNGSFDSEVAWNFQKYLIDENGKLIKMIPPKTRPMSKEIVGWIKR